MEQLYDKLVYKLDDRNNLDGQKTWQIKEIIL